MRIRFKRWLKWVLKPRPVVILGVSVVVGAIIGVVVGNRTQRSLTVALANQQAVEVNGPLRVDFSQDIAAGYAVSISPSIPGTWTQERTLLGVSAAKFKPADRLEAGRTYKLRITGIKRSVTARELPEIEQTFTAQKPAAIKTFSPADKSKDAPVKPRISVTLTEANNGVRELQASLAPAVPLKLVSTDDRTFVWEPVTPLKQGTGYTFVLDDKLMTTPEKKRLVTSSFTVVTPPGIVSARTGGYFSPGQTVDIVFDQPMVQTGDSFAFNVAGKGIWKDERTYRYTPSDIKPGTTYSYTLKAGLATKAGGVLEADRPFSFATNGPVSATLSPGGTVAVNSPMRVAFDQPVDRNSAQKRFSVSPAVGGSFSWSGNTMIYTPSGSAYQTKYQFSVAAGVVPVWGLPSNRVLGGSYATPSQIVKLGVPVYKQAYGRSCELASLRMLLAYRGIHVSDWDILMRIGYSPRARDQGSNSWENPNSTFVGYVDTYSWTQGYGVHSGPVAAAARSYGRNATNHFGVSAAFIAGQIHAGNPVEFYGHISYPYADAWNTTSGVAQTTTSMHARVVYGVNGSASNPAGFYIHDPWTGSSFYWTAGQLMANMNVVPGVSNQAVVVY